MDTSVSSQTVLAPNRQSKINNQQSKIIRSQRDQMFVATSWNADTRPVGTECLTGNGYLRFTPNVVSTKSKINNQQSKIIRPTDKHCVPTGRRTPTDTVATNIASLQDAGPTIKC